MVVIHVKVDGDEDKQFLYECPSASSIDDVADAILQISHLQSLIQTLSLFLRRHFLTRENDQGFAASFDRTLSEAESYASKDQILYKRALSPLLLRDHIQRIEREAQAARSMGLIDCYSPQHSRDCNPAGGTQLWWAGKELSKGKKLSDYIGENDRTKIKVKLKPACSS